MKDSFKKATLLFSKPRKSWGQSLFIFLIATFSLVTAQAQFYNLGAFWKSHTVASPPAVIYRSVGPGNTTALATGSSNAVTISGTTATFTSALPNNVGVGDALQYQISSTWYIAFISGRTSSTVYTVQSTAGAAPTATSSNTTWSLFRAYTSLAGACNGNGQENTGINSTIRNFDTWTGSSFNLVTTNQQWNIALYADGVDTTGGGGPGFITSATNYVRIYAPYLSTDVGASQRHNGTLGAGYVLQDDGNSGVGPLYAGARFIIVDGLQIIFLNPNGDAINAYSNATGTGGSVTISNNIVVGTGSLTRSGPNGIETSGSSTVTTYIYNNVFANINPGTGNNCISTGSGKVYAYNNTLVNCGNHGIAGNGSVTTAKNNIVQMSTGTAYSGSFNSASDYNLSSDSSSPGGSHDKKSQYAIFSNPINGDYRLSTQDATAQGAGENLSADPNLAFTTDVQGITRSSPWDIGASTANGIIPIYRSVGPGNTTALATGTSNAMTIGTPNGVNIATFASALPGNVGVGDAIQYQVSSTWYIAFITSRISSTEYLVLTAGGASPTATSANTGWSIFRAYTGLGNAVDQYIEGGQQTGGTENTGINSNVQNFDTWSLGRNMVVNNEQWNFALYADATDTMSGGTAGWGPSTSWVSDATHTLRFFTPYLSTDVGTSQRHPGYWSSSGYNFTVSTTNAQPCFTLGNIDVWVDGLQFLCTTTAASGVVQGVVANAGGSTHVQRYSNNLISVAGTSGGLSYEGFWFQLGSGLSINLWNNIVYNTGVTGGSGINASNSTSTVPIYAYNNTVVNFATGVYGISAFVSDNNIVQGATSSQAYYGSFKSTSNYNLSNDSTSSGGASDKKNQTVTFNNPSANDFRISSVDTAAKAAGENLSANSSLSFNTDIQNIVRGTTWDIGASTPIAEVAKIYRSVGYNNTTALATGTSNAMTISENTATFASGLPNNVGVGDAIQFQVSGTWYIAFISGRTSSTVYTLQNSTGGTPEPAAANTTWSIFRAYTSSNNAWSICGENTGINAAVQHFDNNCAQTAMDMVTYNTQWNFAMYADAIDARTDQPMLSGWNTSPTNYLRIYTPYLSSEVGVSQRHNGAWTSSGYIFSVTNSSPWIAINLSQNNTWIDGLQIAYVMTGSDGGNDDWDGIYVDNIQNAKISNSIIKLTGTSSAQDCVGISFATLSGGITQIWNNVIYSDGVNCSEGGGIGGGPASGSYVYVYNNTINNMGTGLYFWEGTIYAKNNLVQGALGGTSYGGNGEVYGTGSDYNLSNDTDTTGGSHDKPSKTVSFYNSAGHDYRLSLSDTAAHNAGENLTSDPNLSFSNDIQGLTRGATWDIGASMQVPAPTTLISFTPTAAGPTSFSVSASFTGDYNDNNSAVLWYCDNTNHASCVPNGAYGTSVAMTRSGAAGPGTFTATVTGLGSPINPNDILNLEIIVTDSDGVTGSPMTTTVELYAMPPNPGSLYVSYYPTTSMQLHWLGGGDATSWIIAYQTGSTAPANCSSGTVISGITTGYYTISGITPNQEYSFRVCSVDSNYTPDVSSGSTVSGTNCTLYVTSGTTWTTPSDFNMTSNTVEVIGAGGGGSRYSSATIGGGGGGGGGYSIVTNAVLAQSTAVGVQVGTGGVANTAGVAAAQNTYLCNSLSNCASIAGTAVVAGAYGGTGVSSSASGGAGGVTGFGTTLRTGGSGYTTTTSKGGGGGGAAGYFNNGTSALSQTGGSGDGGSGGAGGAANSAGASGTEYDSTHGSGGGGGGGSSATAGGTGGNYGAGGGGGGKNSGAGGAGGPGLIIIRYLGLTCS